MFFIEKRQGDFSITRRMSSWSPGKVETWYDPQRALSRFMDLANEGYDPLMWSDPVYKKNYRGKYG